jgi:hypothetical protein
VKPRVVVTSSGFVFERRGDLVTPLCATRLKPLAELEYLREVEPGASGRIVSVERSRSAGRALETVHVETAAGRSAVVFDVAGTFVEKVRVVHEALRYVMYAGAAFAAFGALGFMMYRLIWE